MVMNAGTHSFLYPGDSVSSHAHFCSSMYISCIAGASSMVGLLCANACVQRQGPLDMHEQAARALINMRPAYSAHACVCGTELHACSLAARDKGGASVQAHPQPLRPSCLRPATPAMHPHPLILRVGSAELDFFALISDHSECPMIGSAAFAHRSQNVCSTPIKCCFASPVCTCFGSGDIALIDTSRV